jgi:hypothetical protein
MAASRVQTTKAKKTNPFFNFFKVPSFLKVLPKPLKLKLPEVVPLATLLPPETKLPQ